MLKRTLSPLVLAMLAAAFPLAAETPKDPKSPVPTAADGRGPTGPVELKILTPQANELIPLADASAAGGKAESTPQTTNVSVTFELSGYELFQDEKTQTGQCLNVMLDNSPHQLHCEAGKPFVLKNVPRGTHTIRAFPSRPWRESIKEPKAFASVRFHVGEKDYGNIFVPETPLLTYSQPKGKYPKTAGKVLFDFHVSSCTLGTEKDQCEVRYHLDDKPEVSVTKWEPAWWSGLSVGRHAYTLTLYQNGEPVPGPFNLSKGFFEIVDDAAPKPKATPTPGRQKPGAGGRQ